MRSLHPVHLTIARSFLSVVQFSDTIDRNFFKRIASRNGVSKIGKEIMDGQFIFKTEKVVVCQQFKVQTRIPVPPQQFILVLSSANETCLHSASASSTGMLLFSY